MVSEQHLLERLAAEGQEMFWGMLSLYHAWLRMHKDCRCSQKKYNDLFSQIPRQLVKNLHGDLLCALKCSGDWADSAQKYDGKMMDDGS